MRWEREPIWQDGCSALGASEQGFRRKAEVLPGLELADLVRSARGR